MTVSEPFLKPTRKSSSIHRNLYHFPRRRLVEVLGGNFLYLYHTQCLCMNLIFLNIELQFFRGEIFWFEKVLSENVSLHKNLNSECYPIKSINPFHTTGHFRHPLKTSENKMFTDVFREYRKRQVAWNGLTDPLQFSSLMYLLLNLNWYGFLRKYRNYFGVIFSS